MFEKNIEGEWNPLSDFDVNPTAPGVIPITICVK